MTKTLTEARERYPGAGNAGTTLDFASCGKTSQSRTDTVSTHPDGFANTQPRGPSLRALVNEFQALALVAYIWDTSTGARRICQAGS